MPRVKLYEPGQVTPAALPDGRMSAAITPGAAGAPQAQAMEQFGTQLFKDEIQRQDQVAFMEADRKVSEFENKSLYDPKDGALNRRGKDAFGITDTYGKAFDDNAAKVRESLSNDRQKIAFDRSTQSRRRDFDTTLNRHVFTEARKFEEGETENYIKNSTQSAILHYQDPERVQLEQDRATAAIVGFARRNGLGEEYIKQKVSQVLSDTSVGIIDRLLANGQDQAAKQYYTDNKSKFAGDDVTKVEHKLRTAEVEGAGMRGAASIWDESGPKGDNDPVSLDSMIKAAENTYQDNPTVLKAVKQSLQERTSVHNGAQRERHEARSSEVWKVIENGGNFNSVRNMPEFLALPGKEQNEIKTWIVDRADTLKRRSDSESSPEGDALFYRFSVEASSPATQDKFAQTNLMEYRAKLTRDQFNHLTGIQSAIRKGDTKEADKLLINERVQNQIVGDALLSMGLDPTPNEKNATSEKGKQALEFRRVVRDTQRQFEVRKGSPATDEEVQKMVDGLVVKGITKKGIIFDDAKRVYELKEGESLTVKAADVPKQDRAKIEDALRRAGRKVTDEAVTTLYTAHLLKMRGMVAPAPTPPTNTQPAQKSAEDYRREAEQAGKQAEAAKQQVERIKSESAARQKRIDEIDARIRELNKGNY